jgi:ABC-2 type transport system permease protein
MTRLQQTLEVARWEFDRFVKWRQQFVGLLVMTVLLVGGGLLRRAIRNSNARPATVAVVGGDRLGFALPAMALVRWDSSRAWDAGQVRTALAGSEIDGALIVASRNDATLLVRTRSAWTEPLTSALDLARREAALERLVLTPEQRGELVAPLSITTDFLTAGGAPVARSTRIAVAAILGLGLLILFSGFGTMFVGITSEKTQRVTEQIVAMVPPQAWMDGKILGLAGAAVAGSLVLAFGFVVVGVLLPPLIGMDRFTMPPIVSDYGTIALILVITLLGVAMWFAVMAAIAATIDDPNSSTRSLLLFLPMLPSAFAFMLLSKAETGIAQVLSIFPLTSMGVLPMRLMLTTVPWWEVPVALGGLLLAVWLFRLLAGRIFSAAILMHGKEPGLRELWRWMRAAG